MWGTKHRVPKLEDGVHGKGLGSEFKRGEEDPWEEGGLALPELNRVKQTSIQKRDRGDARALRWGEEVCSLSEPEGVRKVSAWRCRQQPQQWQMSTAWGTEKTSKWKIMEARLLTIGMEREKTRINNQCLKSDISVWTHSFQHGGIQMHICDCVYMYTQTHTCTLAMSIDPVPRF